MKTWFEYFEKYVPFAKCKQMVSPAICNRTRLFTLFLIMKKTLNTFYILTESEKPKYFVKKSNYTKLVPSHYV